jgi:hypothetical protein
MSLNIIPVLIINNFLKINKMFATMKTNIYTKVVLVHVHYTEQRFNIFFSLVFTVEAI